MLILVAVTVKTVIDSGLFKHASASVGGYSESQAMEVLGTTLAGALAEKYTNANYNENEFLDEYIKDNIPGAKIAGDVVLIDGWAFQIDRTVPNIPEEGRLGKGNPDDFVQPDLTVGKGTIAADKLSIPLNITALEATNGISKIEIIKDGTVLHTIPGNNSKTTINDSYTVEENGRYVVKVYAKLTATKTIEVTELIVPKPTLTVAKGTLAADKLSMPITISAQEAKYGIDKIDIYKQGQAAPIKTYPYSPANKEAITETYTATENTTYTIKAHTSKGEEETKTIEVTEIVPPSPTAADAYVRYTPDTAGNYTVPTTSGYSAQSIPQDTTLKWKVLSINSDGTIDLIADKPISTTVRFQGALGYNNGVYLLNDLCKSQYSNASLGATARSIDLVDIEKHFNDAGRAARDACTPSGIKYGNTKSYTGTNGKQPDIYRNHDKNKTVNPNNIAQMESENVYSSPIASDSIPESNFTAIQTYYNITSQASYYDDPNFHTLIFGTGKNYWLASRVVNCDSSSYAYFGLRIVGVGSFFGHHLFTSHGSTDNYDYLVRPVVSLGSNFKLQQVTGTNEWEIVSK